MDKNKNPWRMFIRLLTYSNKYYPWLLVFTLSAVTTSIIEILMANPLKNMTDLMLAGQGNRLFGQLALILLLLPLGILAKYFGKYATGRFSSNILRDFKFDLANEALKLPVPSLNEKSSSKVVSILTNDIPFVQGFLENGLPNLIYQPMLFLLVFTYLFIINWRLLLFSTIAIPGIMAFNILLGKSIGKSTAQLQEHMSEINDAAADTISGINVIKSFNLESEMYERYRGIINNVLKKSLHIELRISWMTPLSFIIKTVPSIICIAFGGYLVVQGKTTTGALLAFVYLLNFLVSPASMMAKLISDFLMTAQVLGRIFDVLDIPVEKVEKRNSFYRSLGTQALPIEFDNVSFSYDGNLKTIRNFSMYVPAGKMVALVGESGCGKSTIIKLICGFYSPQEGRIKLFGDEVNKDNLTDIRGEISLVPQESFLFPVSIYENIAFGRAGATMDEVVAAAKSANAHEFIEKLPEGYCTIIGERGANLSGGQKQRISIARAILKNSPIVLLDEPTSSLDTESEALVEKTLKNFKNGSTVLIVAHRLSTIKNADFIYVLKDGGIIEKGTHDDLLKSDGYYRSLYLNQFSGEHYIDRCEQKKEGA